VYCKISVNQNVLDYALTALACDLCLY